MNVKITGNSVTFKISEEELKTLLTGASLETKIMIGENNFSMRIDISDDVSSEILEKKPLHLIMQAEPPHLTLHTTRHEIITLSDMGKNRDGLSARINGLDVFLQVDMRKDSREKKPKESENLRA